MDRSLSFNSQLQCSKPTHRAQPFRSIQCSNHHQQPKQQQQINNTATSLSRRSLLAVPASLIALSQVPAAKAFRPAPPGFSTHEDKLDGYSLFYPDNWLPVTTSGNDVFFRNPLKAGENMFVDVSSPSSSKYETLADFGTPDEAAKKLLDQYLEEFMSTRIGVRRTAKILSATTRTGADGKQYYDIQFSGQSYASTNQLAVTQNEINEGVILEWDRRFWTVLGVANKRLYQLRLQVAEKDYEPQLDLFTGIAMSFQCKEVV